MSALTPLREIPDKNIFRAGDVFVLFGELFGRGYVNGLLDEARKAGMTILGVTVGRRDENHKLRPLTDAELKEAEANLGGRIVNVPLMAGFDLDAPEGAPTPTDLLADLKRRLGLAVLFITHDLATAKYVCDRIAIMYLGKFCEVGPLGEVYRYSGHPYTHALLEAVPVPDPRHRRTEPMPAGEIPSAINPPSGCRFHPRCPIARENCAVDEPDLRELRPDHFIACHYAEELLE